ncbi:hypothetical protein YT1_p10164 (plasmid) [Rhodococcus ruber]|nr:hypothetical protein YT1_p10164 [Rhodococcus ruber]
MTGPCVETTSPRLFKRHALHPTLTARAHCARSRRDTVTHGTESGETPGLGPHNGQGARECAPRARSRPRRARRVGSCRGPRCAEAAPTPLRPRPCACRGTCSRCPVQAPANPLGVHRQRLTLDPVQDRRVHELVPEGLSRCDGHLNCLASAAQTTPQTQSAPSVRGRRAARSRRAPLIDPSGSDSGRRGR